jgi:hypothetical protein
MPRMITIAIGMLCMTMVAASQPRNVGIGTATPDPSAVLDLVSSTQGFLTPRITQPQRDAIVLPAKGLLIYNLTIEQFEYNAGTPQNPDWRRFISVTNNDLGNEFWTTAGNDSIDAARHFLGTINDAPLVVKTANTTRMIITAVGEVFLEEKTTIRDGGLDLAGPTSPLMLQGNAGVAGQVVVSAGAGNTPQYTDSLKLSAVYVTRLYAVDASVSGTLTLSGPLVISGPTTNLQFNGQLTADGQSIFSDTTTFTLLPKMPLQRNWMLVGDANDLAAPFAPGTDSTFLGIIGGAPTWVDIRDIIGDKAWLVGGNPNPKSTIIGNLATTGLVDLDIRAGNATLIGLNGTNGSISLRGPVDLAGTTLTLSMNGNPGNVGDVLLSQGAGQTPAWTDPSAAPFWALEGNTAIPATAFIGTTDANDVRIATNGTTRLTVAQGTGNITATSLAGPPATSVPDTASLGLVAATATGQLQKIDKNVILNLLGIHGGRYVNQTATTQFNVVITMPPGVTIQANASITVTPESTSSIGVTPFVVLTSRMATGFSINFPGGLDPGEAINWLIKNP